jgi:hypothetical protein
MMRPRRWWRAVAAALEVVARLCCQLSGLFLKGIEKRADKKREKFLKK